TLHDYRMIRINKMIKISPVSDQYKGRPEERMRHFFQHPQLRRSKTGGQRGTRFHLTIKIDHHLVGGFVIHHPEAQQNSARASRKETTRQTNQLVTGSDDVCTGLTRTERDQGVIKPQAVRVANSKPAVSKFSRRKGAIIGTKLP